MTQCWISKLGRVSRRTSRKNFATASLKCPATNCDVIFAVFRCGIVNRYDSASVSTGGAPVAAYPASAFDPCRTLRANSEGDSRTSRARIPSCLASALQGECHDTFLSTRTNNAARSERACKALLGYPLSSGKARHPSACLRTRQ